jgi:hypothetical protein
VAPDDSRRDRRESDAVTGMLKDRIEELGHRLEKHVTDCAEQSRKLFWAVLSVLGFLVIKSLPFMDKMFHE